MIAIVDYGVGNLFSLNSSLAAIGADSVVTSDAEVLCRTQRLHTIIHALGHIFCTD